MDYYRANMQPIVDIIVSNMSVEGRNKVIMDYYDIEYMKIITKESETNIKDRKMIEFLNSIKSSSLRRILRYYIEDKCYKENPYYSVRHLKEDFKEYERSNPDHYFLPKMNERLEGILKMLLDEYKY